MGISEILSIEDGHRIRIYKRGMFWVAYERSTLVLCTKKALQVQEKAVKAAFLRRPGYEVYLSDRPVV